MVVVNLFEEIYGAKFEEEAEAAWKDFTESEGEKVDGLLSTE